MSHENSLVSESHLWFLIISVVITAVNASIFVFCFTARMTWKLFLKSFVVIDFTLTLSTYIICYFARSIQLEKNYVQSQNLVHARRSLCVCVCARTGAQSCLTLCDPMDCSLPGSFVHGISQLRTLEWFAISSSRECSQPRDGTTSLMSPALAGELPGKSHEQGSLVGCSPMGREESDMTERLPFHFSLSRIGEGNGSPLQCSCLENPRDGEAWWAAVYGVTQSRTRLKWLNSSSSSVMHWQANFLLLSHLGSPKEVHWAEHSHTVVSDFVISWTVSRQVSDHGIRQARILEWVAISFSKEVHSYANKKKVNVTTTGWSYVSVSTTRWS